MARLDRATQQARVGAPIKFCYTCRMMHERRVRLFRIGRTQAVRIPREFELPGKEAVMRKEGSRLVIEPKVKTNKLLLALLASLAPIDERVPEIDDLPPDPVDL